MAEKSFAPPPFCHLYTFCLSQHWQTVIVRGVRGPSSCNSMPADFHRKPSCPAILCRDARLEGLEFSFIFIARPCLTNPSKHHPVFTPAPSPDGEKAGGMRLGAGGCQNDASAAACSSNRGRTSKLTGAGCMWLVAPTLDIHVERAATPVLSPNASLPRFISAMSPPTLLRRTLWGGAP